MSHNIQKLNWEEQVRFLILRYPQDMKKVAEKASEIFNCDISVEEVVRIKQRFKRTMDKDVAVQVAANLSRQIVQGSQERCAKLEAMFQLWDGKDEAMESVCCEAPVVEHGLGGNIYYVCAKCSINCGVRVVRNEALQKLKIKLIQEMRAESDHLINFAKQMGFTAPQESAPVVNQKNFLIVGQQQNNQVTTGPVQIDARIAQKVDDMSPVEREHLIHDLRKLAEGATEATFESSEKSTPNGEDSSK
jgi:hypothetical protein